MVSIEPGATVIAVLPVQDFWALFREDEGEMFADPVEARMLVNEPSPGCKKGHRFVVTYCLSAGPDGELEDPSEMHNFVCFVRAKTAEEAITTWKKDAERPYTVGQIRDDP